MPKLGSLTFAAALVCAAAPLGAQVVQERVDLDAIRGIREEGLEHSQIQLLGQYLTDIIGPRLTGSPGMRRANEWTAEKLREWGLANVVVEPWGEFGRGWEPVSFSGRILEPHPELLIAYPVAWTGSTRGTVRGTAVIVQADSAADLEKYRGKLRGSFVLARRPEAIPPDFEPDPLRTPLTELLEPREEAQRPREEAEVTPMRERFRRMRALSDTLQTFLAAERVAAVLVPSSRTYALLRLGGSGAGRDPKRSIPGPEVAITHEQYGSIYRTIEQGITVRIELNVQNRFYEDDLQGYNTLGDIPGSDLADEYVMLGAHLDSWHQGTGATDNAAGSIVMMEAARILRAIGATPRRTIRIALWSGEEQGLLGSRNWVENHKELGPKISAYVNVDNGTGRIRGIWDQSNEAALPIFEQILWPFTDLGVVAVRHGNTGGTDHLSFDRAGIPGFNFIQDPIEYGTRTHHTAADRFERLLIDDLKQAAVVVAATVYQLATRDEMMPRKPQQPGN
jgi:hypothetical protein